jgi:hypothetical protein
MDDLSTGLLFLSNIFVILRNYVFYYYLLLLDFSIFLRPEILNRPPQFSIRIQEQMVINNGYNVIASLIEKEVETYFSYENEQSGLKPSTTSSQQKQFSFYRLKYFLKIFAHGVHFLLSEFFSTIAPSVILKVLDLFIRLDIDRFFSIFFFFFFLNSHIYIYLFF